MPEVLTETERRVKSKCGRFTAPIGCLLCDFTTQASHDAGLNYEEQEEVWSEHSDLVHPLVRIDPERHRLERDVIRCAKLFTEIKEGELNATWSDRVAIADNDLDDAVRKLVNFESQHKEQ